MMTGIEFRQLAIGVTLGFVFVVLNYVLLRKLVSGLLGLGSEPQRPRLRLALLALAKLSCLSVMVGVFLWLGTTYTWGLCISTTIFIAILVGSSLSGNRAGMVSADE